jgi:hypothetical protein
MSNISVPHPFRVFCEMGGKPQTFGVRAFPPLRQKKAGCPTLAAFLFLRLGWDATLPNQPVILSEAHSSGVEGPAFALRYAPSPSTRPPIPEHNSSQESAK